MIIRISEYFSFVVSQQQVLTLPADNIFRKHWDLSPAPGRFDRKRGDGISTCMALQTPDDLKTSPEGGPEVGRSDDGIALEKVVRLNTNLQETVIQ